MTLTRVIPFISLLYLCLSATEAAPDFLCAGVAQPTSDDDAPAAKLAQLNRTGTRNALAIFAHFRDEGAGTTAPTWSIGLFDPDRPGSFTHFYDTMSFGQLHVAGEVAPRRYQSAQNAAAYLADTPTDPGLYSQFSLEILRQADADIDFAQFDNDGPDGLPDSGDDDGFVDALFIVVASTPPNFLIGNATGIANLNLGDLRNPPSADVEGGSYTTDDPGADGQLIRITSSLGTIQQGRTYAETSGTLCHEYGHILGLPDLFNTAFLATPGERPENDSAGIGNWGLMGWGTLGWNRDDGPNSFSAWSRARLGWSPIQKLAHEEAEMELNPIGQGGAVFEIPLSDRERYLVEYRRRDDNYYDRNIPAEGVLIWHINQRPRRASAAVPLTVDLESADGRYLDAGFPLGNQPDPQGGDNLDFWSHDPAYAQRHGGNFGDATDPFDGARYTAFTPETNPSSVGLDGDASIRIEQIRLADGVARARVTAAPPRLAIDNLRIQDADDDQLFAVGEQATLSFWIANRGGLHTPDIRAVLASDDPLVEIIDSEIALGDLDVGHASLGHGLGNNEFPSLRINGDFSGTHTAALRLDLFSGARLVGQHPFAFTAAARRQAVRQVRVRDHHGNGDGQAQGGEIIQLSIDLADQHPDVLPSLTFLLRALDERLVQLSSPVAHFRMGAGGTAQTHSGPEFLIPAALPPASDLAFELKMQSPFGTWADTLRVPLADGGDRTPPRVNLVRTRRADDAIEILLSERWVHDGSDLSSARATVYAAADTARLADIPLQLRDGEFVGRWQGAAPGTYLVAVEVADAAGNRGTSLLHTARVLPQGPSADPILGTPTTSDWTQIDLPQTARPERLVDIDIDPGNPNILYATGLSGLWRSGDAGARWHRTGLMLNGQFSISDIYFDPENPLTVYFSEYNQLLKSSDGGAQWRPVPRPDQDINSRLLAVDPVLPGRLYGYSRARSRLLISEDEGQTWRQQAFPTTASPNFVGTHPLDPDVSYMSTGVWSHATKAGTLYVTTDQGAHWQPRELDRVIRTIALDPAETTGLYAIGLEQFWHSRDRGATWRDIGQAIGGGIRGVAAHPRDPDVIYAWSGNKLWVSRDRGDAWDRVDMPAQVQKIILNPLDAHAGYALLAEGFSTSVWRLSNYGAIVEPVIIELADVPTGPIVFDPFGQPHIAAHHQGQSGVFTSADRRTWQWLPGSASSIIAAPALYNMLFIDVNRPASLIAHYSLSLPRFTRSGDGGLSWQQISLGGGIVGGTGANPRLFPSLVADPQQAGVYYLSAKQVYRSRDFGASWNQYGDLPDPGIAFGGLFNYLAGNIPVAALALDPLDAQVLYAAQKETVYFNDDGSGWINIGPVRAGEPILALRFHPQDPDRLYAATVDGLYLSRNRGQTWTQLLAPEDQRWISARLRFDPREPDRLYLLTSRHLYHSGDAGASWREIGADFGGQPWFNDLALDPDDPDRLYASTTWGAYALNAGDVVSAVRESPVTPDAFILAQNYPNPFNGQTIISYQLPAVAPVRLTVYNILGQPVRTLVDQRQAAGGHQVLWDGRDDRGRPLGSGVYYYRLATDQRVHTRPMVQVK